MGSRVMISLLLPTDDHFYFLLIWGFTRMFKQQSLAVVYRTTESASTRSFASARFVLLRRNCAVQHGQQAEPSEFRSPLRVIYITGSIEHRSKIHSKVFEPWCELPRDALMRPRETTGKGGRKEGVPGCIGDFFLSINPSRLRLLAARKMAYATFAGAWTLPQMAPQANWYSY